MDTPLFTRKNLIEWAVVALAMSAIMYVAVYVRSSTLSSPTVLDYDPWWFFRHASEIVANNMQIPKWDELSYFPPGRPYEAFQGWPYLIAVMYKVLSPINGMSLTDVAKWSTLIVAAASVVPAYLLGRMLSNKYGGIATALFAVLSPALIGVSMAGYSDTDMVVTFYTLLSVYSILLALSKKVSISSAPYYVFAILVNLAFSWTWGFGWIILLLFTAFIPAFFVFRVVEQMMHSRQPTMNVSEVVKEMSAFVPLLAIILVTNVVGTLFSLGNMIDVSQIASLFSQGALLIVNESVAELQKINIFTLDGFSSVVDRVGLAPMVFTVALLPLALYKLYRKEKISMAEIFFFMWVSVTFVMITQGVRFSLLFATAAAAAAGYVIGNAPKYIKDRFARMTFYGATAFLALIFLSAAMQTGAQNKDMITSDNWYGMLDWLKTNADQKAMVVTWWDPGHIIAGYTGLRVHADGAHCDTGPGACIPYGHNDRIQDMGRVFSISDEDEAISILGKYRQLTSAQCDDAKQAYGSIMSADACDAVPEMYVLASSDLISKYYWLTYFGTDTGRNYVQMTMTSVDQEQGVVSYGSGAISLAYKDGVWVPVLNIAEQGLRNTVIRSIVYYESGSEKRVSFNETNMVDGMLWVDPSYNTVIFMDPETRDSIFTRMFFFDGEGLQHFDLVYSNSETRLFKVVW